VDDDVGRTDDAGDDLEPADGPFEQLLADGILAWTTEGGDAVEALCRAHPEHSERLRARMNDLLRLGLLGEERAPEAIGPHRLLRLLGQGGMSVVYLAWDDARGEPVALKASHTPLSGDDRIRARFRQEIKAVTALDHPGIVPLYDVGESDGRPWFTMEFVPGATLAQILEHVRELGPGPVDLDGAEAAAFVDGAAAEVLQEEPPPVPEGVWPATWVEAVARWMLDVADALAHAHELHIVHRDVKPSNIMVGLDGRARLFDLGLARLTDAPGLTRSGDFTGTPFYVSPEQLGGSARDVDHRSDVFSLGVTLYELLTLRRPFDGPSTAHVFRQIVDRDPTPPRRLEPRLPAELETICLTALEKNRAARYQTVEELAEDLQRFLEFRPVKARPVGWLRRGVRFMRRSPARATAALLALLVIIGLPAGLAWANHLISGERDLAETSALEAERQAELSAQVTDFLVDLFHLTPLESERAETVTAREILDRGAAAIPTGFEVQPIHRAALMQASGRVYRNMGQYAQALPLLDRAYAIFQRERGVDDIETLTLLAELADVHRRVGDLPASQALSRRAVEGFERAGQPGDEGAVRCRMTLAAVSAELGAWDEAREALATALALRSEVGDEESVLVAELEEQLGASLADSGAVHEGRAHLERSLALRRASWVPDPVAMARVLERLSAVHRSLGEGDRAEALAAESRVLTESLDQQRDAVSETEALAALPPGLPGHAPESPFALHPARRSEFDESFQDGVTALQSEDYGRASEAFLACLELAPRHAVSAYNLACAHARAGNVDSALHWVDQAIDFGFGFLFDGPDVLAKDPDLESLRGDPRWGERLARMQSGRDAAERYAAEPALHVPDAVRAEERWPLLVVLHASGSTKDSVVNGPWRAVADELGLALLAPSARLPVGHQVEQGMRWFRDADEFLGRPWAYESQVIEDIRAFCTEHPVDRRRVYIAGEGLGSLLAADLALTAPGLFLGLLVVNGPLVPEVAWQRTLVASSLGLGIRVVLDDRQPIAALPEQLDARELGERVAAWLPRWGLGTQADVHVVPTSVQTPPETTWIAALSELDAVASARGR
jgi:serine/threonine protein kinase/predicted esterase